MLLIKAIILLLIVTLLNGYTISSNTEKKGEYPTKTQVENFIKEGGKTYQKTTQGTSIIHVMVKIGDGFTRLELIGTETKRAFSIVKYQQIRPYRQGFLLIDSNNLTYFNQSQTVLKAYEKQVIALLKTDERVTYADSTIEERQHLIYEPRRLLLHYDGRKLTIKQWLTE